MFDYVAKSVMVQDTIRVILPFDVRVYTYFGIYKWLDITLKFVTQTETQIRQIRQTKKVLITIIDC